jgi:hypothetical protein
MQRKGKRVDGQKALLPFCPIAFIILYTISSIFARKISSFEKLFNIC